MSIVELKNDGYKVVPAILNASEIEELAARCEIKNEGRAGSRSLLRVGAIQDLARRLASHAILVPMLPDQAVAVQCTYFRKSPDSNWLVGLHRDKSIPVKRQFDSTNWRGWSVKEGVWYVQPPNDILDSLVAVRLHLDDTSKENGALQLVPESHRNDEVHNRVACEAQKGDALLFKPRVLHASSKIKNGRERRVLHFLFGPPSLPEPAEWAYAV